ncbi:hypothetical protein KBY97_08430 [Synechococcus sp. ATX 2A4]|uniref:YciI family protein n=1 Tax=Synechococcus sp. ATX 2A4 TaxID=2823727 RepID=UPI0020CF0ED7|nr:YciI family protein [Synechococcus sp. ATX 2A4]MCP9885150.1 hypothetical protein [Synechococcus sp. ATX 2A4]
MRWFVKLEEGTVGRHQFDQHLNAHLAWVEDLKARGHCPTTGYWHECKGQAGAGGMLLFKATGWEEAETIVRSDPLIQAGSVRWILHEWRVVAGSLEP